MVNSQAGKRAKQKNITRHRKSLISCRQAIKKTTTNTIYNVLSTAVAAALDMVLVPPTSTNLILLLPRPVKLGTP